MRKLREYIRSLPYRAMVFADDFLSMNEHDLNRSDRVFVRWLGVVVIVMIVGIGVAVGTMF